MRSAGDYPRWMAYPRCSEMPSWIEEVLDVFRAHRKEIDTTTEHNISDEVLRIIRPDLEEIGFIVEGGKYQGTIKRPVLFGEYGLPDLEYHIDSYHPEKRIGLEIEAGRSVKGNAIYRDIIQASLMVGIDYFFVAVPVKYRFNNNGRPMRDDSYANCKAILDAIYSTTRFSLPFKGIILIGY